jgi:hypothetical protein
MPSLRPSDVSLMYVCALYCSLFRFQR